MFETQVYEAPIDSGSYEATLVDITIKTVDFGEGPQDRAEWSWQVHDEVDHEGQPLVVTSLSGLQYGNEKANLTKWANSLGWTEATHPAQNDLVGRDAMLNLEATEKGYMKVLGVTPVPKRKK